MGWLEEMWIARKSNFSNVIVLRSEDEKRLNQVLFFLYKQYTTQKALSKRETVFYLYKPATGLQTVTFLSRPDGRIIYQLKPVTTGSAVGMQLEGRVRDLPQALHHVLNAMVKATEEEKKAEDATAEQQTRRPRSIVAVFWDIVPYKSVTDSAFSELMKVVRGVALSPDFYLSYHTLVIFTPVPELVLGDDTLRHCIVVDVPFSTDEERENLLKKLTANLRVDNADISQLVELTRGLTLHEVESVVLYSFAKYGKLDAQAVAALKNKYIKESGVLDVEEAEHGFEAVGGYDYLKDFVRKNIVNVFTNPEKARRLGLRPPRGLLLFGPPGTGKTWFAKALAKELGLPFLRMRTEDIVSKWYGETTKNMAKALRLAESMAPCVLFIDEIDRFGRRGNVVEHEESRRAFSVFLEWLGDPKRRAIIVGTTNRPQDLDEAFRRVGRFDYMIPFPFPDREARKEILRVHTSIVRKVPLADDVDLEALADSTQMWSGAEIEELVMRAARNALMEDADTVNMRHFEEALQTFRINVEERKRQITEYAKLAEEMANDVRFLKMLKEQI